MSFHVVTSNIFIPDFLRVPDLGSSAGWMGDHLGTPGAEGLLESVNALMSPLPILCSIHIVHGITFIICVNSLLLSHLLFGFYSLVCCSQSTAENDILVSMSFPVQIKD